MAQKKHRPRSPAPPPSGWHFWRRAFWSRPALLGCYSATVSVLALALVATIPGSVQEAVAMREAPVCPVSTVRPEARVDPPPDCLESVPVVVQRPYGRRARNNWPLSVQRDTRLVRYATAVVPTFADGGLRIGTRADALLWQGTPVVLQLPSGERIETMDWGHRPWLLTLAGAAMLAGGALMLLDAARLKRRSAPSWWSVSGRLVWPPRPPMLPSLAAVPLLLASMPAILALLLGPHVGWAAVAAVAGLGVSMPAVRRVWRLRAAFKGHPRPSHAA